MTKNTILSVLLEQVYVHFYFPLVIWYLKCWFSYMLPCTEFESYEGIHCCQVPGLSHFKYIMEKIWGGVGPHTEAFLSWDTDGCFPNGDFARWEWSCIVQGLAAPWHCLWAWDKFTFSPIQISLWQLIQALFRPEEEWAQWFLMTFIDWAAKWKKWRSHTCLYFFNDILTYAD